MTINPGRDSIASAAQSAQNFEGLNPVLQKQVNALVQASHGKVYIKSGYRSPQEQQALYDTAAQRYGAQYANNWVADPQASNHVQGLAVDLGGDLQVASQLAPQFGLNAPMPWEPWHFEFPSTAETAHSAAYTVPPAGEMNPTQATKKTPGSMAASIAESLLSLQQKDQTVLNIAPPQGVQGPDALTAVENTAPSSSEGGTPNYTPGGGAFGGVPEQQWATDFLTKIGAPTTGENIRFMTAWMRAESGGGGGHFNPLNTTQHMPGSTPLGGNPNQNNGDPVQNFTNYQQGIDANAQVLNNGRYQGILDALMQGNNAMSAAQALANSPWGTGSLVEKVLSGG